MAMPKRKTTRAHHGTLQYGMSICTKSLTAKTIIGTLYTQSVYIIVMINYVDYVLYIYT